jgi:hypothetical protein
MRSLLAIAANSNGRRLVAALVGIAAVLLLPFSTGAKPFTELPTRDEPAMPVRKTALLSAPQVHAVKTSADNIRASAPSTDIFSRLSSTDNQLQTELDLYSFRTRDATSAEIESLGSSENGVIGAVAPWADLSAVPVSIDELTQLLENREQPRNADTDAVDGKGRAFLFPGDKMVSPGEEERGEPARHEVVGTSYQIGLLGVQVQTGLAMEKQTTPAASTITGRISAQAPLGSAVSVNAELELVDVDRLRSLTEHGDSGMPGEAGQTKIGVGGQVRWSEFGSLRIGYELVHMRNSPFLAFATSADTSVEYHISDRARVAAGFHLNSDRVRSKATANVGVGYQVSRNSSLSAGYQLINFSALDSQEYQSNAALAELIVRF